MSDELYTLACLTTEQREEIELLEMKACMALLDDQIVQLRRCRSSHSDLATGQDHAWSGEEYHALLASVAQSTSLARQLNERATLTISERFGLIASRLH